MMRATSSQYSGCPFRAIPRAISATSAAEAGSPPHPIASSVNAAETSAGANRGVMIIEQPSRAVSRLRLKAVRSSLSIGWRL